LGLIQGKRGKTENKRNSWKEIKYADMTMLSCGLSGERDLICIIMYTEIHININ